MSSASRIKNSTVFTALGFMRTARLIGLAAVGALAFLCISGTFSMASSAVPAAVGWTSPVAIVHTGSSDGYAAAVYHRRAYVADVTTLTSGANSYSQIWFSTNRTGKWTRTLVAKIPDDPDTGGGTAPRIAVIPASGHAVIVVMHVTGNGSELLTFVEQPGGTWQQEPLSLEAGNGTLKNPSVPSLTAQGSTVAMAFSSSYSQSDGGACGGPGYAFITRLTEGGGWSQPSNVTADYCGPKGGWADDPVVAFGPSGGLFMIYQCAGDPNGSPGALCIRSGNLGPETEKVIGQNTADWSLDVHRLYALKVGADGTPHIIYIMLGPDRRQRLMYATTTATGWMQEEIATGAPNTGVQASAGAPSIAQLMWPSIALGASGPAVAFVGSVKYPLGGSTSMATFLMHESDGRWSKPANFTGSKFEDAAPILASSAGLLHLFMSRDGGESYLYAHEAPLPRITFSLSQAQRKDPLQFAAKKGTLLQGTVVPSVSQERIKACTEKKIARSRWTAPHCVFESAQPKGNEVDFRHDYPGFAAGHYRLRVEVGETADHMAGASQWSTFAVK